MSSSAGRSQLGWSLPAADWERFVDYVVEKRGAKDPHVRFELEAAMIEFVDRDSDLAEAESLLRDAIGVSGLSSSIEKPFTRDVSPENKRQVGYRVRTPLKEELKAFVDRELNESDNGRYAAVTDSHISYGEALTAAITEYRDGAVAGGFVNLLRQLSSTLPRRKARMSA